MIAVNITTYNNPRSLELCLLSLSNQTYPDFEVFIADDGSGEETRNLILRLKEGLPFPIHHVWHADEGYRKAKINNAVFRQLDPQKFPLLICIDHDVILHPRFVEDHYLEHETEKFSPLLFMGRRIDLGPQITSEITPGNVLDFTHGLSSALIRSAIRGETRNILRSCRVAGPEWLVHLMKRDRVCDLLGSNFSVTLQVMKDVNGYNEDFKSYWGEDGDFFVRVRNSGVKIRGRIGYAIQWHLYHKRLEETEENIQTYRSLLGNTEYKRCEHGIIG